MNNTDYVANILEIVSISLGDMNLPGKWFSVLHVLYFTRNVKTLYGLSPNTFKQVIHSVAPVLMKL